MGTIVDKLNKLLATKADIKAAIIEKGQTVLDSDIFANYGDKIRAIKTDPVLQSKTVAPTGQTFTITPDDDNDGLSSVTIEGDSDLVPENIAKDVTIYGVTGTLEAESGSETLNTTAIDYSAWDSGSFRETLETGDTLTYAVEFDASSQPTKITAPDGTVTTVEWGES